MSFVCLIAGALLVVTPANAALTWTRASIPGNPYGLFDGSCLTQLLCYFSGGRNGTNGNEGDVYKTTDGGGTWTVQPLGTPHYPDAISCPGKSICFTVDNFGLIARTTNGGRTWKHYSVPDHIPGQQSLFDIDCADTKHCVTAVGVHTIDGGRTWIPSTTGSLSGNGVSCPSVMVCYVASGFGTVLKTTDGGTTFGSQSTGAPYLIDIWCPSVSVCYAGGGQGIWSTTDGGVTWQNAFSGPSGPVYSISCVTVTDCAAATSEPVVYVTSDGVNWTTSDTGAGAFGEHVYGVTCPVVTRCYAEAYSGLYVGS